ncbi:permease prefix domain 2-containing transporter [Emticicia sp. 21SJ11W-3]|uniref:permease prefix domain 2-containing transporter n=1 Tax=Emticicia sp. 21SJ11W-3 TaxID=2916755 RepID=UPI00209FE048|nr:permease prefix domain 2-containing transporter [Emticicia sp. 21SJ11W-3]UTA66269.1 permease prefix domain 2-containing transporter [Emticicia sp. 21SJ11W-3]
MKKQRDTPQPPSWADKLLEWFVAPHLLEYVQGDLHENFYKRVETAGITRARREYLWAVLNCLTPFFFKRKKEVHLNSYYKTDSNPRFIDMLSNYLTVAFRNLWRHKAFTSINIVGLAVGLATCLLIVLFVKHELSYDRYHAHADRIYRMIIDARVDKKDIRLAYASEPAGPALMRDYSGIEAFTRLRDDGAFLVKHGTEVFKEENIAFVDSNFFSFFALPIIKGNAGTVLIEPKTLVLSESKAKKYFGFTDPIGKTLSIGHLGVFRITGICKDLPSNTHFHFDMFGSVKSVNAGTKWMASGAHTYLRLREGYTQEQLAVQSDRLVNKYVNAEIKEFFGITMSEFNKNGNRFGFSFQPVTSIHLHSDLDDELDTNSNIKYVYIFTAIAAFILLLACINFMNLSTAGSAGRSKEVGIRKVLGSVQKQLIGQFLTESVLLTLLSMVLAIVMVLLLLPGFNSLTGKQFTVIDVFNIPMLGVTILACLLIGVLAGFYPAFVLSAFKPVAVLKGKMQANLRSGWLRDTLVTGQFVVSIGLIIATIIARQQLSFMQTKKLGFNKEQVLVLHDTEVLGGKVKVFKENLAKMAQVTKVSSAGFMPAGHSSQSVDGIVIQNGTQTGIHRTKSYFINEDYLPTLGMQLALGRNFSKELATDSSAVLLNEAAVRVYGFKNPIGKQISTVGDGTKGSKHTYTIVGVVKDFHFENMRQRIAPLVMFYGGDNNQLALRIKTNDLPTLLSNIEKLWKAETENPFAYSFLNDRFNSMYDAEHRIGQIFSVCAGLAIFIACLGLFGLAAFTTYQRTKEIGVRKVLGASVTSIVGLLLSNYLKLILIAIVIASPIAGYSMSQWLQDFAYKVSLSWWVFVLAGGLAALVAILTVSYQAIKAALVNPMKSLKTD